jgi:hypothetical protein
MVAPRHAALIVELIAVQSHWLLLLKSMADTRPGRAEHTYGTPVPELEPRIVYWLTCRGWCTRHLHRLRVCVSLALQTKTTMAVAGIGRTVEAGAAVDATPADTKCTLLPRSLQMPRHGVPVPRTTLVAARR